MAMPAVCRHALRGLFYLFAAKAHRDHKRDDEHPLLKLSRSSEDVCDSLLDLWSDRAAKTSTAPLEQSAGDVMDRNAIHNHASAFLHALLRELGDSKTMLTTH